MLFTQPFKDLIFMFRSLIIKILFILVMWGSHLIYSHVDNQFSTIYFHLFFFSYHFLMPPWSYVYFPYICDSVSRLPILSYWTILFIKTPCLLLTSYSSALDSYILLLKYICSCLLSSNFYSSLGFPLLFSQTQQGPKYSVITYRTQPSNPISSS